MGVRKKGKEISMSNTISFKVIFVKFILLILNLVISLSLIIPPLIDLYPDIADIFKPNPPCVYFGEELILNVEDNKCEINFTPTKTENYAFYINGSYSVKIKPYASNLTHVNDYYSKEKYYANGKSYDDKYTVYLIADTTYLLTIETSTIGGNTVELFIYY